MQPIRTLARFKKRVVHFVEAQCTGIDVKDNTITITGTIFVIQRPLHI